MTRTLRSSGSRDLIIVQTIRESLWLKIISVVSSTSNDLHLLTVYTCVKFRALQLTKCCKLVEKVVVINYATINHLDLYKFDSLYSEINYVAIYFGLSNIVTCWIDYRTDILFVQRHSSLYIRTWSYAIRSYILDAGFI